MIQTLDGTREKNSTIVQFQRVSGIGTATVKTHKPQNNAIRYFRFIEKYCPLNDMQVYTTN